MVHLSCSRRNFLGSTALVAAATAIPSLSYRGSATASRIILVSEDLATVGDTGPQTLLLVGPRIDRLQAMAAALRTLSGEVVLRLDAADDSLLDVAAQQAAVILARGKGMFDRFGTRANVALIQRNTA